MFHQSVLILDFQVTKLKENDIWLNTVHLPHTLPLLPKEKLLLKWTGATNLVLFITMGMTEEVAPP